MIRVGITGGIGSGKSTVCKVFELLNVPVYYSDLEAKLILETDPGVLQALNKTFGPAVLDAKKKPDRKKIAAVVFSDKKKLEELNAIIHPAVGKHFEEWCKKNADAPFILKEAAILFESGAYRQVDKVIMVTAPLELKIARIMKRDRLSKEEIEKRINSQLSDEEKAERSDFVIRNDETVLLTPQILEVHRKLAAHK